MIIGIPEIIRFQGKVRAVVEISAAEAPVPRTLWFEVPEGRAGFLSRRADAAMLALLVPAMKSGEDIRIEGAISARLLESANGECQRILRQVMPFLKQIKVEAASTMTSAEAPPHAHVTGYSGGGDTLCTLLCPRPPDTPAFTHVTHYNVGSHGRGKKGREAFCERVRRAATGAARFGLALIPADSNLDEFYDKKTDFIATHAIRNAAATLCLQNGIARYEYSSAYHRKRQGEKTEGDISRVEDALMPLFSTETLTFTVFGSDMSRVEKILFLAEQPIAYELLDVCVEPRKTDRNINCSGCLKCMRAMIILDIAGKLGRFAPVFDLRKYRLLRWWAFTQFLHGSEDSRAETEAYARERGFIFPAFARFCARSIPYRIAKLVKGLIERAA